MKQLPLALKLASTAFIAVLVPVYWRAYGFANFFSFCDLALFITVAGLWREDALLLSIALVATLVVDLVWIGDVARGLLGYGHLPLTAYMFEAARPVSLKVLSLFHLASPLILLLAVRRLGYDRRALLAWLVIAIVAMAISYAWLPPPGPGGELRKVNVNWVYGLAPDRPQDLLPPLQWLALEFSVLFFLCWWPAHRFASTFLKARRHPGSARRERTPARPR